MSGVARPGRGRRFQPTAADRPERAADAGRARKPILAGMNDEDLELVCEFLCDDLAWPKTWPKTRAGGNLWRLWATPRVAE